ncbi:MAG: hypothetical protein ABJB86_25380 [Bacteroidota bacterium]
MPVSKIILISIALLVLLFAAMLYLALSDTIRDLSKQPTFQSIIANPHKLKKDAHLYRFDKGSYRFYPQVLTAMELPGFEKIATLPAGTVITINAIKTYKGAVAGFTNLFVLGGFTDVHGKKTTFEYMWDAEPREAGNTETNTLPRAVWQDESAAPVPYKFE